MELLYGDPLPLGTAMITCLVMNELSSADAHNKTCPMLAALHIAASGSPTADLALIRIVVTMTAEMKVPTTYFLSSKCRASCSISSVCLC